MSSSHRLDRSSPLVPPQYGGGQHPAAFVFCHPLGMDLPTDHADGHGYTVWASCSEMQDPGLMLTPAEKQGLWLLATSFLVHIQKKPRNQSCSHFGSWQIRPSLVLAEGGSVEVLYV